MAALLSTSLVLGLCSAAIAGPAPEAATSTSKLKWKARGALAKQASAVGATSAPSTSSSAAAVNRQAVWRAPARAGSRSNPAPRGEILPVSADKTDPFQDPFQDDPIDGSPAGKRPADATTRTSQPAAPDSAAPDSAAPAGELPSPDQPSRMKSDSDPFPDERVPDPLDETLPENQPVVPGLAPPDMSCDDYKKECNRAIEELRNRDITKIIFGMVIEGEAGQPPIEGKDYPCECLLGANARFTGRDWSPTTFTWKATGTCFKPLYFQDVQLERYGHSWNPVLQPFMSAAHFFVSVPLLPYKMGLNPPCECEYTLGYYRPGSCAPYTLGPIPISLRAAAFEALGVTGFAFWFWPPPTPP